jgi:hypothetical protein
MKTYADYNRDIEAKRTIAKKLRNINDDGLGVLCGMPKQSIRNRSHDRTFPEMPFWPVVLLARASGGDIEIK